MGTHVEQFTLMVNLHSGAPLEDQATGTTNAVLTGPFPIILMPRTSLDWGDMYRFDKSLV